GFRPLPTGQVDAPDQEEDCHRHQVQKAQIFGRAVKHEMWRDSSPNDSLLIVRSITARISRQIRTVGTNYDSFPTPRDEGPSGNLGGIWEKRKLGASGDRLGDWADAKSIASQPPDSLFINSPFTLGRY